MLSRFRPQRALNAFSRSIMSSSQARQAPYEGATLANLPKSWRFTEALPHDSKFPTPADSHKTPRDEITPRHVQKALFTWVRPEPQQDPELLATSAASLKDLGIKAGEELTEDFRQFVAGNKLYSWDEDRLEGGYPWAQCYGGYQFGQWAGQLGDGRAISLFETTNEATGIRYELQLKGAGMTPYSRFADGKAVLRSSIREFVVSEALNAMGIKTTRALSLTLLPHSKVFREGLEPGAIVLRYAQSWLRLGTFDLLRARGDRDLIRKLATYVAEDVFGGWDKLPGRLEAPESDQYVEAPKRGASAETLEGPPETVENRFTRLYREIVRRNAATVAHWQAYGFMNGVLNTDNTSVYGLSMDYGPFAFMDNFDPSYTPNHDDGMLRYAYRNQPTIIWWNLVRLGEALGEMMGAGSAVDSKSFVENGVQKEEEDEIISRAETLITQAGNEFKATFLGEYKRLMAARFGLVTFKESDFEELCSEALDAMENLELDFHHFFRRLSSIKVADITTPDSRKEAAKVFFHNSKTPTQDGLSRLADWLEKWRLRVIEDHSPEDQDGARIQSMKKVNPNFIARGWILDEIIRRVEKEKDREVLGRLMQMALHPFEDEWTGQEIDGKVWHGDAAEEQRWVGDVPKAGQSLQCSCSS